MIISMGIDVSKLKLDIYHAGKLTTIENKEEALKEHVKDLDREIRVVMEATGKYHRLAHRVLVAHGFKVMVINPYQSRHFAKAMNVRCKTDAVDAKILCQYGETMRFEPTLLKERTQEELQELSKHLDDLKQIKVELDSRLKESTGSFIEDSLKETLKTIKEQIKETQKELKKRVSQEEGLKQKLALLMSIPGLGEFTGVMLLSYLKELGEVSKNEIAALTGLAPMNQDSGQMKGKRRIKGGRRDVRSHLYMVIVGAATQHNERLKALYQRHLEAGKPVKVALTACMRKLVIWANAILSSGLPWQEDAV